MDVAQAFLFDAGWIFFATWGVVLIALGIVAFGRDILPGEADESRQNSAVIAAKRSA